MRLRTEPDNIKISAFAFPQSINLDLGVFIFLTVNFKVLFKMLKTLFFIKELFNTPDTSELNDLSCAFLLWFWLCIHLLFQVMNVWTFAFCWVGLFDWALVLLGLLRFLHLSCFDKLLNEALLYNSFWYGISPNANHNNLVICRWINSFISIF